MDRVAFLALAFVAGAIFPLQAVVNARLGASAGGPIWAAFLSFLVGTIILLAAALAFVGAPRLAALPTLPWWIWIGGAIGALLVFTMALAAPRTGTAALLSVIVAGQMAGALALDRYGILQPVRPIGPWQALGAVLLVAGVAMIVLGPRR